MNPTIRLSQKVAQSILSDLEKFWDSEPLPAPRYVAELRAQLGKPNKAKALRRKRKDAKRATKRDETSAIYAAVMARANARCEACDAYVPYGGLQLDHMFGRVRVRQSERNCWALCHACHVAKTHNRPSATHWLLEFIGHAGEHDFTAEARMAQNRFEALELSRGSNAVAQ